MLGNNWNTSTSNQKIQKYRKARRIVNKIRKKANIKKQKKSLLKENKKLLINSKQSYTSVYR